jgi:hypothetical protein
LQSESSEKAAARSIDDPANLRSTTDLSTEKQKFQFRTKRLNPEAILAEDRRVSVSTKKSMKRDSACYFLQLRLKLSSSEARAWRNEGAYRIYFPLDIWFDCTPPEGYGWLVDEDKFVVIIQSEISKFRGRQGSSW